MRDPFRGKRNGDRCYLMLKALAVEWSSVDQLLAGPGAFSGCDCIGGECVGT